MSLTIGASTFADPAIGLHGIAGQYWLYCHYSGAQYAIEKIHAPGEAGHKVKRHGFSGRTIEAEVIIVGANPGACHTALATIETNVLNQTVSVTPPGGSEFANCEVTELQITRGPQKTEASTYRMQVKITADQLRNA